MRLSLDDGNTKELLSMMEKNNKDIRSLLEDSLRTNSVRPPKTTSNAKRYRDIRNHAKYLYNVLKHHLADSHASNCSVPHNASLCLEHRNGAKAVWPKHKKKLSFSVLFSFESSQGTRLTEPPWYWRETEIEPLESFHPQAQPDGGRHSQDSDMSPRAGNNRGSTDALAILAATGVSLAALGDSRDIDGSRSQSSTSPREAAHETSLLPLRNKKVTFALTGQSKAQGPAKNTPLRSKGDTPPEIQKIDDLCKAMLDTGPNSCLGVLVDERQNSHRVSITKLSSGKNLIQTVSLQDLLAQTPLGKRERLILGVKIASTLLQLHNTPWLGETWGNVDIRFQKQGQGTESAALGQPLLSRNFISPTLQPASSQAGNLASSNEYPNKSLFALGLVLTELWFGKPIDHLRETADLNVNGQVSALTDYATITRLVQTVQDDAGQWYGDAVRRCVHFDMNQRFNNLETETFKEAVHREIVLPLEENLSAFCGGSLERVLC